MKSCHTEIIINAPISRVWKILLDVDRYPKWNPSIAKIWGTLKEGRLIFAHVTPLKNIFPVKITSLKEEQELIWKGTVLNAAFMQGEHYYLLRDLGNGQTELQHGEHFSGLIGNLTPSLIVSKMKTSYQHHNEKLKVIAEQGNI